MISNVACTHSLVVDDLDNDGDLALVLAFVEEHDASELDELGLGRRDVDFRHLSCVSGFAAQEFDQITI